ncbi:hypothetical protein ACIQU1_31920 [Streptomyces angustmyceticus]|uniref:hypothetical protein n=1 Tax=Streptomyces angustmyceticus TaxID=285578 RepID=UPI00344F5E44
MRVLRPAPAGTKARTNAAVRAAPDEAGPPTEQHDGRASRNRKSAADGLQTAQGSGNRSDLRRS